MCSIFIILFVLSIVVRYGSLMIDSLALPDIDLSCESPIGHGRVICFSIYCGPQYNFGSGPSVFVDLMLGESGILNEFKSYFEDRRIKKVWHNYSFDRAVLGNHDVNVQGFGGDTMHMARLWSAGSCC